MTAVLEKLSICECAACIAKRPAPKPVELPTPSAEDPLRIRLIVSDGLAGTVTAFTNKGKALSPARAAAAAKATTEKRTLKREHIDHRAALRVFSLSLPGEKELKLSA